MNLLKRYLFLLIGLLIMAIGVAFSICGNLGTSPISSLPYVLNQITGFTVGQMTICMHCFLIVLQILLLRRQFELYQLMQLPVAFAFGYMMDFGVWLTLGIHYQNYLEQWILCLIGVALVAIGVSIEFTAHVIVLAGEGVVLAVSKVTGQKKSSMKICFDVTLVVIAVILSLLFLKTVTGVREGTVAAAILVGMLTRKINPVTDRILKILLGENQKS